MGYCHNCIIKKPSVDVTYRLTSQLTLPMITDTPCQHISTYPLPHTLSTYHINIHNNIPSQHSPNTHLPNTPSLSIGVYIYSSNTPSLSVPPYLRVLYCGVTKTTPQNALSSSNHSPLFLSASLL